MKEYERPSSEIIRLAIEEVILLDDEKDVTSDNIPDL